MALACRSPHAAGAAPPDDRARLVAQVDSVVEEYRAEHRVPGMSIAVVRARDTLVFGGFGYANLEDGARATAATVYRIGSITKQFTAAAVLRLVEQGRIGLDLPVQRYMPTFIGPGGRATVRQLLTHTSGIPNYTEVGAFARDRRLDLNEYQLLDLFRHRPLDFAPGSAWHYSNSNYYLLGLALEQAGGVPYAVYLERTLLQPLGLDQTRYCSVEPVVPHRAAGYSLIGNEVVNASYLSMQLAGAAGALCSTIGNLLQWQADLRSGRVVRPETYRLMTTPALLADGTPTRYGFALDLYTLHSHPTVEHSGGINGFSADLAYYPADSLSVVVLMNSDATDAALLARRIAELVLRTPDPGRLDLAVDTAAAVRYVGTYHDAADTARVEQRGGRLVLIEGRPHPLRFQGAGRFVVADDHDTGVEFTVVDGRARALTVTDPDGSRHQFVRAP